MLHLWELDGLAGLEMEIAPEFDHDYRVGGGGTVGTRIDLADNWRMQNSGDTILNSFWNDLKCN